MIYQKIYQLKATDRQKRQTSELVQLTAEGVEQLESYFTSLPSLSYQQVGALLY